MVKLVSFFVFLIAFVWTWFLFHSTSKINVGVHAGLQSKLAIMIEDTIKKARPNSYSFKMLSLYTTKIDDNKINAHFSYKYSERLENKENSEIKITGDVTLNRSLSENPDDQKWVVQNVQTDNSSIEFQEGLIIGAGEEPAPETVKATPEAPSNTPPAAVATPATTPSAPQATETNATPNNPTEPSAPAAPAEPTKTE